MYKLEDVLLKDFFEENDKRIKQMEENIRSGNLCFVLGAGVSQSKGFPN